jgi:hypothetical protein
MSTVQQVPLTGGTFNPGSNTPNGSPFVTFVDNPYISLATLLLNSGAISLGITASSTVVTSGEIMTYIKRASAWINRYTQRWFDIQRVWETHTGFVVKPYNPQLITVRAENGPPYNSINQLYIQVLKWFISIDLTANTGYLQDFYDKGFCKIVPLLSSAGTGAGSPLPAAIVDRIPLGVLWSDYTSGFGQQLTGYAMGTGDGSTKVFQSATGNQLWAPGNNLWSQSLNASTPLVVYDNAVVVPSANYTVDYPNGKITFIIAPVSTHNITADFWTYETIPDDIRYATILLTLYFYSIDNFNPMMHNNLAVPGLNISYNSEAMIKRVQDMLEPYIQHRFTLV